MGFREQMRQVQGKSFREEMAAMPSFRDMWREQQAKDEAKRQAKVDAKLAGAVDRFKGIALYSDRIEYQGQSHPLVGVRAEATRQTAEVLGDGYWTTYLTVSGPGFQWPVKAMGMSFDTARAFAAQVNSASQPEPAASGPDVAGQLAKLAELHQAGALTDDEFAAAKQRLLG